MSEGTGAAQAGAREVVLDRIRRATADRRPVAVPRDYRGPGATQLADSDERVGLFTERVQDYRAAVHRCAPDEVAGVVGGLVTGPVLVPAGFPPVWLPAGVDVLLDEPPLPTTALDAAGAVVTTCAVAVARTGTIVLDHGPGQGRRAVTLVPDHHVVVVRVDQVVVDVPDAVAALDPTRPLTWISGPSATSDIELERVEGVHGPRRLDVVLVAGGPSLDR